MKILTVATNTLSGEPRSTAYYYADLERLKKKPPPTPDPAPDPPQNELSEYVETNEVFKDGPIREVPPLRDRPRQYSLPEYNTPENSRKIEETYSTAGTFPMPEPKEKEPLLAELEVVGRLPLTQLDSTGVRRSRSWYLCCPNVGEQEISRESSWRYASLRPVTAPPTAGQNGLHMMVASQSSRPEDVASLRAERDALARALATERRSAAAAARAHDARLAELHGVIAELVRRRAHDKQARAIPEEEVSDECESTTQPAGELEQDADMSRTEQNDTSSALSPSELAARVDAPDDLPDDSDTETRDVDRTGPRVELPTAEACDTSLELSDKGEESDACLGTATGRCSEAGSCERERGSPDEPVLYTHSTGRCESRQAKLASRVRLKKTDDVDAEQFSDDECWSGDAESCAHEHVRDALGTDRDGACACACASRCVRLRAERRVLRCALARAADTAHRLYCACAVQESTSVSLCCALRAADRALEAYDVLLALAETHGTDSHERASAELVASQLLARLEAEPRGARVGEPLLSPGPWLQHRARGRVGRWCAESEARLRGHAARLKADTVALRGTQPPPKLFSYHDVELTEGAPCGDGSSAADMEAAVALLDALTQNSGSRRKAKTRHWLETNASETDL